MKPKRNRFLKHIQFRCNLSKRGFHFLSRLLYWLDRILFACDIPNGIAVGENTTFYHLGLGVVLHNRTIIGNGCKIYQNVTIGSRNSVGPPRIGDNVIIGANAVVLGDVTIGNNARIGANAVVLTSVPEGATAVGNPARIIKND